MISGSMNKLDWPGKGPVIVAMIFASYAVFGAMGIWNLVVHQAIGAGLTAIIKWPDATNHQSWLAAIILTGVITLALSVASFLICFRERAGLIIGYSTLLIMSLFFAIGDSGFRTHVILGISLQFNLMSIFFGVNLTTLVLGGYLVTKDPVMKSVLDDIENMSLVKDE